MRNFTGYKLRRLGLRLEARTDTTSVTLFVARPDTGMLDALTLDECRGVLAEISDRWNACADALAVLEKGVSGDTGNEARAILRRAIEGEE
jgi:hypothetical protein